MQISGSPLPQISHHPQRTATEKPLPRQKRRGVLLPFTQCCFMLRLCNPGTLHSRFLSTLMAGTSQRVLQLGSRSCGVQLRESPITLEASASLGRSPPKAPLMPPLALSTQHHDTTDSPANRKKNSDQKLERTDTCKSRAQHRACSA